MILDEIKKANVEAMKAKNTTARSILGVVMNKAMLEQIKKRETNAQFVDADMVQILQKTIKELIEEKENYLKVNNAERAQNIEMQKSIVESFLPKMMSEQEIYDIISKMEDKSIPTVMKKFKMEFAGKCDMKLVQDTLKKFN